MPLKNNGLLGFNLDNLETKLDSLEEIESYEIVNFYGHPEEENQIIWRNVLGKDIVIRLKDVNEFTKEKFDLIRENINQKIFFQNQIKTLIDHQEGLKRKVAGLTESQEELMIIFQELQQQNAALEQINQINKTIHGARHNIDSLLNKIAMYMANLVAAEQSCLYFHFEKPASAADKKNEIHTASYGFKEDIDVEQLVKKCKICSDVLKKGHSETKYFSDKKYFIGSIKADSMVVLPAFYNQKVIGLIILINKTTGTYADHDYEMLSSIINQTITGLRNMRLMKFLKELFVGIILALSSAIDAKDPYTYGHSERVMQYSMSIVKNLEYENLYSFTEQEKINLRLSAILHDIGKIGTMESVLRKPTRLTNEEYNHIKEHPVLGAKILSNIENLQAIIQGVKHHHERFDGKGYPDGLSLKDIPFEARIIAVADTFDAMTSDRPYRKGLAPNIAFEEINKNTETQFDPLVVTAFNKSYENGEFHTIIEEFDNTTLEERIKSGYFVDEIDILFQ